VQQVGNMYCRCTIVEQKMYYIKFVFTVFSTGPCLYLSWAGWMQTVSRIACLYISLSLWNKNLATENGFWTVFRNKNLYFVTHCMLITTCIGMCHPSMNLWNVTYFVEGVKWFKELWEISYQGNIWPIEGVNKRIAQKIIYWCLLLELLIMLM